MAEHSQYSTQEKLFLFKNSLNSTTIMHKSISKHSKEKRQITQS